MTPPLRPIKVKTTVPQLAFVHAQNYRDQIIQAALERKGKKRT